MEPIPVAAIRAAVNQAELGRLRGDGRGEPLHVRRDRAIGTLPRNECLRPLPLIDDEIAAAVRAGIARLSLFALSHTLTLPSIEPARASARALGRWWSRSDPRRSR